MKTEFNLLKEEIFGKTKKKHLNNERINKLKNIKNILKKQKTKKN